GAAGRVPRAFGDFPPRRRAGNERTQRCGVGPCAGPPRKRPAHLLAAVPAVFARRLCALLRRSDGPARPPPVRTAPPARPRPHRAARTALGELREPGRSARRAVAVAPGRRGSDVRAALGLARIPLRQGRTTPAPHAARPGGERGPDAHRAVAV